MSNQPTKRTSNLAVAPVYKQQHDKTNKKYPDYLLWSIESARATPQSQVNQYKNPNLATPKKEATKKGLAQQRSQSQQHCRGSAVKENHPTQRNSVLSMRSPQSQISTHHQSQASNMKSNSVQRTPYMEKLEREYSRKNYDNIKKYLDLAKINRRVTANDVKKLAANPLSGFNTQVKGALTMENIHKRIIKETEYKMYDYTSQINLPISYAREEEHPHEMSKQITPCTRSLINGTHASQMKLLLDDASSIVNLPGSLQRITPNNKTLKDKQVERYVLPSALSDEVARNNPQIRYIYEDRGKKIYDGFKNNNQFHISIQYQPDYVSHDREPNPIAYKKNASTLRIY